MTGIHLPALIVLSCSFPQIVTILSFVFYEPAYYSGTVFPHWAQVVGWMMASSSFVVVPGYALYALLLQAEGSLMEVRCVIGILMSSFKFATLKKKKMLQK